MTPALARARDLEAHGVDESTAKLDLRKALRKRGAVRLQLEGLSAHERATAAESWRGRMATEWVSARVFASLVPQAMRAGLDAEVVATLARMTLQELDHAERCGRVLCAFDEEPIATLPALPEVPTHEDAAPIEALLRNVISVSCCSETVAVALVGSERELAQTPELRSELDAILADEVLHARFGWRLVARVMPSAPTELKRRLGVWLIQVFQHQIAFYAPWLSQPAVSEAAIAVGAADGAMNFEAFVRVMETITVPRLEVLGLPARRAWSLAATRARAA